MNQKKPKKSFENNKLKKVEKLNSLGFASNKLYQKLNCPFNVSFYFFHILLTSATTIDRQCNNSTTVRYEDQLVRDLQS